jgi:hypothetical protein
VVHGVIVHEVGCAQPKPMPSSHETSTIRLPAVKAANSSSVTKTRGAPGSCNTQLTTMSLFASKRATGIGRSGVSAHTRSGVSGSPTPWAFRAVTAPRAVAPNPPSDRQWFISSKAMSVKPPIYGDLSQGGILHAVRPSPDDLCHIEFRQILGLDLGQQNDIAVGDELFPGADSADERR